TTVTITGDVVVRDCCDDDEIEIREMKVDQERLRLEDAQASLDEHLQQSPEVTATFDGFVTMVGVEGGDEVSSGSVAAVIADPNQFEALILASENDIGKLAEGTDAEVGVDAISGLVLPAEVTHVAPTASISSGVVNYEVTIQVASLDELRKGQNRPRDQIDLHEGMSVTVTLYPAQKSGVLVVPNTAISVAGGRHIVTVISDDGTEEQRRIVTGISDWQNTEVIEGLEEGETVLLPAGATATEQQQSDFGTLGGGRPRS
ncbi:MAG: efflux RND transporter periplasmic adaptor subunit, partial [Chloroflexota bacterium]